MFGEFLADAIGGSEVAAFAGGLAVGDQFFDIGVAESAFFAVTKLAEFGGVVVFEDGEDALESGEELLGGGDVLLAKFAFVDRDVGLADEIVSGGEGLRGVEVVSEAGVEIGGFFGDTFGHGGGGGRFKFSLFKTIREVAETVDGAGGLLQAVEGEIELAAVGNAGEGKAQS